LKLDFIFERRAPQNLVKKVLVFASGRGTDFQAIVDHQKLGIFQNLEISALICNHEGVPVLDRAEQEGVRSFTFPGVTGVKFESQKQREEARVIFDRESLRVAKELEVDYAVLAGFDQLLGQEFVRALKFSIMNIHPAYDLKTYGGKNMVGKRVHELVLKSGAEFSGCTIHYVTEDIDLGPVILKRRVDIIPGDTPESLERRILDAEHLAYPEAIQLVCDGRVLVDETSNRCFVDKYSGNWDIEWESRQQKYIDTIQRDNSGV
jgi:phosphoribosylglycinamide formyltransferase 1